MKRYDGGPIDVTCTNCGSNVTIEPGFQQCSECGADISEQSQQASSRVREIKRDIREVITGSKFELEQIRQQRNVVRVKLESDNGILIDDPARVDENIDKMMEARTRLSELKQRLKEVDGVRDIEEWGSDSNSHQRGSKYGMRPNTTHLGESQVILLIGTDAQFP